MVFRLRLNLKFCLIFLLFWINLHVCGLILDKCVVFDLGCSHYAVSYYHETSSPRFTKPRLSNPGLVPGWWMLMRYPTLLALPGVGQKTIYLSCWRVK